ncbi:MAG: hypothetical protein Udaeo2_26310 [Candidatus Udaeobacter sp.]|nr:MAG: hypothetical protein Udaeo2_26310 [Candidatus Udaeobacter sp.]
MMLSVDWFLSRLEFLAQHGQKAAERIASLFVEILFTFIGIPCCELRQQTLCQDVKHY